jgi:hypothetical protein
MLLMLRAAHVAGCRTGIGVHEPGEERDGPENERCGDSTIKRAAARGFNEHWREFPQNRAQSQEPIAQRRSLWEMIHGEE